MVSETISPPFGVYTPVVTFFNDDESINYDAITQHVGRLLQARVKGLVVHGSNGEATHLLSNERAQVIRHIHGLVSRSNSDAVIIAGCSANSVLKTVRNIQAACDAGADFALVLPPSYWSAAMNKQVIKAFYLGVASKSPLPVLIYNFPGVTSGIDLDSDLILELANESSNIVGVKLTCGNLGKLQRISASLDQQRFAAFAGKADFLLPGLVVGSNGVISALANLVPRVHVEVIRLYTAGDLEKAKAIQAELSKADWALLKFGISGVKTACEKWFGYGSGRVRSPLPNVDNRQRRRRRVADTSRKRAARAERPPSSDSEISTPQPVVFQNEVLGGPEENITIDNHSVPNPEEQEVVVTQAQTAHTNRLSDSDYARLKSVFDSFPPRPVADFLVSVCIRHGVDIFFYFDQAQIMDEIAQFYTNSSSPLRTDPSFICLALGLFALGSNWTPLERPIDSPLPHGDDSDLGRVFFRQAKLLIPDVIERSDLKAIQAFFLLGIYLMPLNAAGSSYVYMGMALRKALAFDLHQSPDDQRIDDREKEIRCRLWWSIYSLERCTTLKLNRPRSVPASIIGIPLPSPMPSLDRDQKFENLELQIAYARLMLILDGYSDSTSWLTNSSTPTDSNKIQAELRSWKKSLPEEFDLEDTDPRSSRYRAIFHLYLNYYYAWIVIGKTSLIMRVRTNLQQHLGQGSQPRPVDQAAESLSASCTRAAKKLLQLFEKLVQSGNSARFSFTDFQGCSIATIITLIAGILQRDSTYDTRVNFGLNCLRQMVVNGNPAATVGVKFVETLRSISDESARKLRQSSTFTDTHERADATSPSAYNYWAEWLAAQEPSFNQEHSVPEREANSGNVPSGATPSLWPVSITLGESWSGELHPGVEASSAQRPSISLSGGASGLDIVGNDHLSTLYHDDQNFLMGLTGLDVLDFAGYSS
ncbi:transcriptional regulatory [Fusarium pseudocircinatum]|uniref:Transcriptional regulatory n=1 Tax=Fusarium pseudocircinatum TaxID=56676 RepID=A0A8H5PJA6_9HYPO|nr:transcriptional regulatory [Fusarium pseudocircinatum]